MSAIQRGINKLLPFTDPSTPIWRDIIHSVVLCTFLYFAPQIQWQRLLELAKGKPTQDHGHARAEEIEHVDEVQRHETGEIRGETGQDDAEDENEVREEQREAPFNLDPAQALGVEENENGGEGPANGFDQQNQQHRPRDPSRVVGAKKAKSLARRDRVRAYNEFLRQQGEAQRAQEAEGAEEREAEAKAERLRREKAEKKIEEAKVKERLKRKEQAEAERTQDENDRQKVRTMVSELFGEGRRAINLQSLAKEVKRSVNWVADLLKREGMLGSKMGKSLDGEQKKILTMITQSGWLVRIDEEIMRVTYAQAAKRCDQDEGDGEMSWQEVGKLLVQELTAR